MNDIEFIYFDVGGVLVDWSRAFHSAASKFNLTVNDIGKTFDENHDQITKGLITSQELWRKCIKKFNIQNAEYFNFVLSWVKDYKPLTQMHDLVYKIRSSYKIGLLSNIYQGMLPLLLEKKIIPIIKYDEIIFSCDVGMMKPNLDIYELAQKKVEAQGDKILLIDDRFDFLEPAKELHWQTFLFENKQIQESVRKLEKYLADFSG